MRIVLQQLSSSPSLAIAPASTPANRQRSHLVKGDTIMTNQPELSTTNLRSNWRLPAFALATFCALTITAWPSAQAQNYAVIYNFSGAGDISNPVAITMDQRGNIYGDDQGGCCGGSLQACARGQFWLDATKCALRFSAAEAMTAENPALSLSDPMAPCTQQMVAAATLVVNVERKRCRLRYCNPTSDHTPIPDAARPRYLRPYGSCSFAIRLQQQW